MTSLQWRPFHRSRLDSPVAVVGAVLALAVFNAGADYLNNLWFHIPLFFDTIGTTVATALFGLLPGLVTAVGTHVALELMHPESVASYLPWMACSMSSALILWLHVRNGRFSTVLDVLVATLWVALANALMGALIAVLLFSGITGHAVDYVATALFTFVRNVFSATFLARLPVNLADKAIAVLVAFLVYRLARPRRREPAEESAPE